MLNSEVIIWNNLLYAYVSTVVNCDGAYGSVIRGVPPGSIAEP